jgi:hypothetical protein
VTDNARKTGPAVEAHFQFLMWLVPTVEKFPRAQKFVLGDRIQATALDVLERLIEATYTRDRKGHLARAVPAACGKGHSAHSLPLPNIRDRERQVISTKRSLA